MIPKKFEMWHKKGVELSLKFLNSTVLPAETLYLLGNNILFAIALYTSMQMAEFFGSTGGCLQVGRILSLANIWTQKISLSLGSGSE